MACRRVAVKLARVDVTMRAVLICGDCGGLTHVRLLPLVGGFPSSADTVAEQLKDAVTQHVGASVILEESAPDIYPHPETQTP